MDKKIKNTIKGILVLGLLLINFSIFANPAQAAASFVYSRGGGNVSTGQTITVTVSARRDSAYNAARVVVTFNNLTYVGASAASGWTPVEGPARSNNTVVFSGAMLGGSVTGTKALLTVTFRAPTTAGTATVSSSGEIDGTGLGTGKESASGGTLTFNAIAPTPTPTPLPTARPVPGAPSVGSETHPKPDAWYKATEANLYWTKEDAVTDFSYSVDTNPATNPDDTSEGAATNTNVSGLVEGVNYFHIKAKNETGWGTPAHYQLNIDKSAPEPFTITAEKNNEGYVLYFATNDKYSGIEKFSLKTDGADQGVKTSGTIVAETVKVVVVTAYDKAGNSIDSTLDFETSTPIPTVSGTTSGNNEKQNSSSNNNLQLALIIGIILLAIYSVLLTVLYLRGISLDQLLAKIQSRTIKRKGTPSTPESGLGKSPLK